MPYNLKGTPKSVIDSTFQRMLEDISSNRFKPGERLPGDRELAREYGIGRSSMIRVLAKLQEERYVERIPVHGTFIRKDIQNRCQYVQIAFVNCDAALNPENVGISGWSEIMEIMRGMFEEASLHPGCQITLLHCEDSEEEEQLQQQLENLRRFDGVVFCGYRLQALKHRFAAEQKPAMVVSPKVGVVPELYPTVSIDPLPSITQMAHHIAERAAGKKIILLHWQISSVDIPLSEKMRTAIAWVFDQKKVKYERIYIDKNVASNAEAHAVLDARFGSWDELRGSVIWCLNRRMLPVINYLLNKNQIQAALYGGPTSVAGSSIYPPVTHLREPHCQVGREAIRMLHSKLCTGTPVQNIVLEPAMYCGAIPVEQQINSVNNKNEVFL
jgi:DNA-binding LacI/PurR family transcriptional regulator